MGRSRVSECDVMCGPRVSLRKAANCLAHRHQHPQITGVGGDLRPSPFTRFIPFYPQRHRRKSGLILLLLVAKNRGVSPEIFGCGGNRRPMETAAKVSHMYNRLCRRHSQSDPTHTPINVDYRLTNLTNTTVQHQYDVTYRHTHGLSCNATDRQTDTHSEKHNHAAANVT